MSTFKIPDTEISVQLVDHLSSEQLLAFPAFKNWFKTLQTNLKTQHVNTKHPFYSDPYSIKTVTIQSIDRFGDPATGRLGFIKLSVSISNGSNENLAGAVFLRGASVGMMIVLQPDDLPDNSEAERYVLLTVQPRVAAGSMQFVELPAGMVDDGTFKGSAAKEIQEELGLEIPEDELINLTELAISDTVDGNEQGEELLPKGVYPSSGGCDEYIPLFLHEKRIPRSQLKEWEGKLTGLRDEGEKISLKLVKIEELWKEGSRDAKALCAWALYQGLKSEGKL